MPIQKNNDTNILPDSFTKIPDAISVSSDDNQVSLMQSEKQVRLEGLARVFPCLITAESRRRKLQRFLDLPNLTLELIWFPLITYWLATYCCSGQSLSIAIAPTSRGVY